MSTATAPTPAVEALVRELYSLGAARREIGRHALKSSTAPASSRSARLPARPDPGQRRRHASPSTSPSPAARSSALANAGYVTRERDPEDGRAQVLATTEAGDQVLLDCHRRMVDAFATVLHDWSDADLTALTERLARLNEAFTA